MSKKSKIIFIIVGCVIVLAALIMVALFASGVLSGSIQETP